MTDLTREQRRALETSIKAARVDAEIAAAEALRGLRVPDAEAPPGFDPERRAQRNRLRAHARALDDKRAANGAQAIIRLTEQAAYVQWHRLLFARYLVERGLLRDETGAPVSLTDCREIALDLSADEDEWSVASGFAAGMLPGIFPPDDPVEGLRLTRERGRELRNRLLSIDAAAFQANDSLVSVQDHVESWESLVIPCRKPRFAGADRCGLLRTVPGMTAVSCAIPAT